MAHYSVQYPPFSLSHSGPVCSVATVGSQRTNLHSESFQRRLISGSPGSDIAVSGTLSHLLLYVVILICSHTTPYTCVLVNCGVSPSIYGSYNSTFMSCVIDAGHSSIHTIINQHPVHLWPHRTLYSPLVQTHPPYRQPAEAPECN